MPDESVLGGTAGVPILGDLVGANFAQRVKLDVGGDGASTPVVGALPVSLALLPGTYAEDAAHTTGDIGHLALAVRNDAGTALAGTTGDYIPLTTDATGAARVVNPVAATPTLANVSAATSSTTLLAANAARMGATLWNDSTSVCYVKFGSAASATSATVKMAADTYFEVPFRYSGIITGIWVAATGSMRTTEVTV